jgi:hypothetical protein
MIVGGALFHNPREQFFDSNGDPLAGGSLTFYASGTSTPQTVYSDQALTVPLTNVVVLDADGRAPAIYLQGLSYKVILKNSGGVSIWTADPVSSHAQVLLALFGQTLAGGGRGVTSGYVVTENDSLITVASSGGPNPCVINLPAVATRAWPLCVKQAGTVALSLTPNGADKVDDVAGVYTVPVGASPHFPSVWLWPDVANGTWRVVASHKVP